MRINRKLNNEFQLQENNNITNQGANEIPKSNIKTSYKSSSYTLENTAEYLQQEIKNIAKYLKPYISKMLNEVLKINSDNVKIICDYIIAEQNELNIKESTKETKIKKLVHLSRFFYHKKTFFEI